MPRYNRTKKGSRWNTERAVQGGVSAAGTGFSVAGPKGAAVAAPIGFVIGGLTGKDTSINRAPYDAAIAAYSKQRRKGARFAGDESAAQSGAAFTSRGINNSELAAGVISTNRGRFMRDAETDIGKVTADINLRIAEAQQQAEMADDEETRQGWLDLAQQLGTMAIGGEFTKGKLTEGMIDSLRASNPSLIKQWVAGDIDDKELIGIYQRREKLLGKPGTQRRRFSDLEEGTQRGALPKALLPTPPMSDTIRKSVDEGGGYEQSRRESIPTSPDGTQGEPANINIAGKPIAPLPEGAKPRGITDRVRQVLDKESFDILQSLYGDVMAELEADGPHSTLNGRYIGGKPYPKPEGAPERLPQIERAPIESMGAEEPWWPADHLATKDDDHLLELWNEMQSVLSDPRASEAYKQRAALQLGIIKDVYKSRTGADQGESMGSAGVTETWQRQKHGPPQMIDATVANFSRPQRTSRWSTAQPPEAKRKGKPEALPKEDLPIDVKYLDSDVFKTMSTNELRDAYIELFTSAGVDEELDKLMEELVNRLNGGDTKVVEVVSSSIKAPRDKNNRLFWSRFNRINNMIPIPTSTSTTAELEAMSVVELRELEYELLGDPSKNKAQVKRVQRILMRKIEARVQGR